MKSLLRSDGKIGNADRQDLSSLIGRAGGVAFDPVLNFRVAAPSRIFEEAGVD